MKQWNEAFKKQGKIFLEPQEDMAKIAALFRKRGVKKVLDLGCGTGRHLVYFAKNNFDVYGIDIAEDGIEISKKWLNSQKLEAHLNVGSIHDKLPYKDNFFDAVVSTQTINHGKIKDIRQTISEIERVLKLRGSIFITVQKRKFGRKYFRNTIIEKHGKQKSDYKIIESRTYAPTEGIEKGLPHYLFNRNLIKKEFHNFKIHDIWVDSDRRHYCFQGELKEIS